MFAVVIRLEDTLKETEKQTVEGQPSELRAMIGNVAHDLKTVRILRILYLTFNFSRAFFSGSLSRLS